MGRWAQSKRRGSTRGGATLEAPSSLALSAGDFYIIEFDQVPAGQSVEWQLQHGLGNYGTEDSGTFTGATTGGETSVAPGTDTQARARVRRTIPGDAGPWSDWDLWP